LTVSLRHVSYLEHITIFQDQGWLQEPTLVAARKKHFLHIFNFQKTERVMRSLLITKQSRLQ